MHQQPADGHHRQRRARQKNGQIIILQVDSRNISKNGSAAARMSRQNTSIQPHSSTKSTVDGTTLSVSMEMAVTASITGK